MEIEPFFDPRTWTQSYVVFDPATRIGVVIDPVLDFDPKSGRCWTESADAIARFVDDAGIRLSFALDTHVHADHLSALDVVKRRHGSQTVIGAEVGAVQRFFRDFFNLGPEVATDGRPFDVLMKDGDRLPVGPFEIEAIHTPGHTPACLTYRIGDALFVGDTLFAPDYGTARCDFPGGSAEQLYDSIEALHRRFPPETRVFTCHDYCPGGRAVSFESTLAEQARSNVQLSARTTRADFVEFRKRRDAELEMPVLILPAVQVNIRVGRLPEPESNGVAYLKLPINAFAGHAPERVP